MTKKLLDDLKADLTVLFDNVQLPAILDEACRYVVEAGGKKIRPRLALAAFLACDGDTTSSDYVFLRQTAMCLELLHGYSLVHDDLPCMDDDDLRRGKPTCHVVYGENVALLVGDVLQSLAFESLLLPSGISKQTTAAEFAKCAKLLHVFAPKARRMVAGQMRDVLGEKKPLSQSELEAIHIDKTGALIEAALVMGGVCANAPCDKLKLLGKLAYPLGLAFQVQDDVLDVTKDTAQLGKPAHSDDKLDKSTYVKLLGVDDAKAYANRLFDECYDYASQINHNNQVLIELIQTIEQRSH